MLPKNFVLPSISEAIENILLCGNRCGHSPESPRFFTRPETQKHTFDIIHRCTERLQDYYQAPEAWLSNLEHKRLSERQQRSERREAIASLSQVLVNHADVATLKIVQWTKNDGGVPISIKKLASLANLTVRRTHRALRDLREAGYLELTYRVKDVDGKLIPQTAIKRLSALFFYHLGIGYEKLRKCREHAAKRLNKLSRKAQQLAAEAQDAFKSLTARFRPSPTKTSYTPLSATELEQRKKLTLRLIELRGKHPTADTAEIHKMAQRYVT